MNAIGKVPRNEVPEDFSTFEMEPTDYHMANYRAGFGDEKIPSAPISESPPMRFDMPQNEEENQLSLACSQEAMELFAKLPPEQKKQTAAGAIAAELFSQRVRLLRQQKLAAARPVADSYQAHTFYSQTGLPESIPAQVPPSAPGIIRTQLPVDIPRVDGRTFGPPQPLPKPKGKYRIQDLNRILGIENYGLEPQPPTIKMVFSDVSMPGNVLFELPAHWVHVTTDELGIDRNIAGYIDKRWDERLIGVPQMLGRKGGMWRLNVVSSGSTIYDCDVLDTRIVQEFWRIRSFTFLIYRSTQY